MCFEKLSFVYFFLPSLQKLQNIDESAYYPLVVEDEYVYCNDFLSTEFSTVDTELGIVAEVLLT